MLSKHKWIKLEINNTLINSSHVKKENSKDSKIFQTE